MYTEELQKLLDPPHNIKWEEKEEEIFSISQRYRQLVGSSSAESAEAACKITDSSRWVKLVDCSSCNLMFRVKYNRLENGACGVLL
ncbi:unnamed protein product [Prunus armeniaca]|uniref:Uncharacterized protein n=1 Tax=Prunus armeniaca TaxID=36596 RepID=A0A6J5UN04_PRUAR|nr:unnamed protein product [Prunus armeniaca]